MTDLVDQEDSAHAVIESSHVHYRGAILTVVVDDIALASSGARMTREYIAHDRAVAILPVRMGDCGEEVLLIRQYRHPVRSMLWEIPAGLMDIPGEDPIACAHRELREETDLLAASMSFLTRFWTSPGCSQEHIEVYLATGLTSAPEPFPREDEEAEIEMQWFPLAEVVHAVLAGQLASPSLVSGVLAYSVRNH